VGGTWTVEADCGDRTCVAESTRGYCL
jgi:hypothetical protein